MNQAHPKKVGYLGPEGTFTHQALDLATAVEGFQAVAYATIADVITALERREVDAGLVPIENSVEGAVTATLDGLAFGGGALSRAGVAKIAAEILLPIHFDVFVAPGMEREPLREAHSHPHALAQCLKFIRERGLVTRSSLSTAEACQSLRDHPRPGICAIASAKAGAMYGLSTVARGVDDLTDAVTRFVLLAETCPPPTGHDKTSLVLTPRHDRPGSLVELLQEFSSRRINLARIESRPLKTQLGRYCFLVDAEGHIEDADVSDAVKGLLGKDIDVKFLGSYAAAGHASEQRPRAATQTAPSWLPPIRRVGIIGLGLIGGSIASALKRNTDIDVVGFDADEKVRQQAESVGIKCASSAKVLAGGCDVVVLATPLSEFDHILQDIAAELRPSTIVTDVGSVKTPVMEAAQKILPAGIPFIGGHPMAGSEHSGFGAARVDLFRGSAWALMFDRTTQPAAFLRISRMVIGLGARAVPCTPREHDEAVATISHVPHIIAYALMSVTDLAAGRALRQELAAGSFRDIVRVAGSNPATWGRICHANRGPIRNSIDAFTGHARAMTEYIRSGTPERTAEMFGHGRTGFDHLMHSERTARNIRVSEKDMDGGGFRNILEELSTLGARIERIDAGTDAVELVTTARIGGTDGSRPRPRSGTDAGQSIGDRSPS